MFDYKVNKASEADIEEHLNKVFDAAITPPNTQEVDLNVFAKKIRKSAYTFECWDNHSLVGLAACYLNEPKGIEGYITHLSVINDYQRRNIAYKLIHDTIEEAIKLKFHKLTLDVLRTNERAYSLYMKFGFYVSEYSENTYRMTKLIR